MDDKKQHIRQLYDRWINKTASGKETEELFRLLEDVDLQETLDVSFKSLWEEAVPADEDRDKRHQAILSSMMGRFPAENPANSTHSVHRIHFLRRWGWAAASIILLLGFGAYFWTIQRKHTAPTVTAANTGEIQPGTDGAMLTLADGSQVVLDSLGNGVIAQQNGAQVELENGQLYYEQSGEMDGIVSYNSMSTPKGRQFRLTLPDGTRVWLNAASSIRFPTVFAGKERNVLLTGEAYFEVVKDKSKPFMVNAGDATVQVLGTHFNINAYPDARSIKTTLLEGSVRIINAGRQVIIKPGQQAQAETGKPVSVTDDADLEQVLGWKENKYIFRSSNIRDIMKELSRGYDFEVEYTGKVTAVLFVGTFSRNAPLPEVLQFLEKTDAVHFRIEGRKVIVMP